MATLYDPNHKEPYKLSRSKIESFIRCPHCFYLDRRLGISQPSGPGFTLNIAVDALLKNECDGYRARKEPHPIAIEYHLDAIPYQPEPADLMDKWRNNFQGVPFLHTPTNFMVYGAIDDIWVTPGGELVIIDYKATSKQGEIVFDQDYHDSYRRQLDIYVWLFKMNGYPVYEKAYFVYCNGIKGTNLFDNQLNFKTVLIEHPLNTTWIDETLKNAQACLDETNPPERSEKCQFCSYLTKVETSRVKKDI